MTFWIPQYLVCFIEPDLTDLHLDHGDDPEECQETPDVWRPYLPAHHKISLRSICQSYLHYRAFFYCYHCSYVYDLACFLALCFWITLWIVAWLDCFLWNLTLACFTVCVLWVTSWIVRYFFNKSQHMDSTNSASSLQALTFCLKTKHFNVVKVNTLCSVTCVLTILSIEHCTIIFLGKIYIRKNVGSTSFSNFALGPHLI